MPPTPFISPNTSNQNFVIAILFNVVQRSENHIFEDDSPGQQTPPRIPIISQDTPSQNFDIAVLFNVIESSGNYVFEDDTPPPQPSEQGL